MNSPNAKLASQLSVLLPKSISEVHDIVKLRAVLDMLGRDFYGMDFCKDFDAIRKILKPWDARLKTLMAELDTLEANG